jgi:hypothetical protein
MTDIVVPDVAGEILGWRAWKVVGNGPYTRLQSVNAHEMFGVPRELCIWPTNRWMLAACVRGHVDVPHEGCKCGLYAAETRSYLLQYGYANYEHVLDDLVIGVVGLVGKVIPGTQGWKAQRARVVRLEVPYEKEPLARRLGELYRVPVGLGYLFRTRPPDAYDS